MYLLLDGDEGGGGSINNNTNANDNEEQRPLTQQNKKILLTKWRQQIVRNHLKGLDVVLQTDDDDGSPFIDKETEEGGRKNTNKKTKEVEGT